MSHTDYPVGLSSLRKEKNNLGDGGNLLFEAAAAPEFSASPSLSAWRFSSGGESDNPPSDQLTATPTPASTKSLRVAAKSPAGMEPLSSGKLAAMDALSELSYILLREKDAQRRAIRWNALKQTIERLL